MRTCSPSFESTPCLGFKQDPKSGAFGSGPRDACHDHGVPNVVERALALLKSAKVQLNPGLSGSELDHLEQRLDFQFSNEHRAFLQQVLPTGDAAWPDWRNGDPENLLLRLAGPVDGALFDVRENGFWPQSWGDRPADRFDAQSVARRCLEAVPRLVPLYGHRFLPAAPAVAPSPVFSVHQTDVIYYGDDLADYVAHEFKLPPPITASGPRLRVPFWSDLAEGAGNDDL